MGFMSGYICFERSLGCAEGELAYWHDQICVWCGVELVRLDSI